MKWNEWFEGFDLEPLQSDLSELCGNLPMSWEWVSLSKWLEMSDLTKPYQNEWNRWEMNELRWIEWNEWIEGFDFVNPMARSLWSEQGVPMKVTWDEWFDQTLSKWSDSMRNEWIEVKWVKWSEMSDLMEMTWNNPMGMVLWVGWECPYGSDLMLVIWSNPIKMIRIDEKWMNRVNRGEMSEWMEMTWNNPMGMVLWSVESVPIKVTGMNPMRMSLSKWMESMRNEWNEVNRGE